LIRRLFIPLAIGLVVVIGVSLYGFGWVPSQERYFDSRNLRLLETMGAQIKDAIETFDSVFDHASDEGLSGNELKPYFEAQVPNLKNVATDEQQFQDMCKFASDPPRFKIERDEGTNYLYLTFKRVPHLENPIVTKTDLNALISHSLPAQSPFDAVLLAQSDGTVIFRSASSSLEFVGIDNLRETGSTDSQKTKIDVGRLRTSSNLTTVELSGIDYRLYSHPVRLSFSAVSGLTKPEGNQTPEVWILAGLVRSSQFRSDSLAISSIYIIVFTGGILLLIFAYPFLKVAFLKPRERLRSWNVVLLGAFSFLGAGLLTFLLLDSYSASGLYQETTQQLSDLAGLMNSQLAKEETAIWLQLKYLSSSNEFSESLTNLRSGSNNGALEPKSGCDRNVKRPTDSRPLVLTRGCILSFKGIGTLTYYPYFMIVSWDDGEAWQRIKWDVRQRVTPIINYLKNPKTSYFADVKQAYEWRLGPADDTLGLPPNHGIALLDSPNTGENISVFWWLLKPPKDVPPENRQLISVSLVTRPRSFVAPVVAGNFQFAVIDPNGLVLFHSEAAKNQRENFFEETDQDARLRALVSGRSTGSLWINYLGRGRHMFVTPLKNSANLPWSLVVFQDMLILETMNAETLTLASYLFLFYGALLAGLWSLIYVLWPKYPRKWFWPNDRNSSIYHKLIALNLSLSVLLLLWIIFVPLPTVVATGIISVPICACVLTFLMLNGEGTDEQLRHGWIVEHTLARVSLLLLLAVLPAFGFFKIAYDFEMKLLVKEAQMSFLQNVRAKRDQDRARQEYQNVNLWKDRQRKLLSPWDAYDTPFLNTQWETRDLNNLIQEKSVSSSGYLERFLSWSRPQYNPESDVSIRIQGMLHDDHQGWTWSREGDRLSLGFEGDLISSDLKPFTMPGLMMPGLIWYLFFASFIGVWFLLTRYVVHRVLFLDPRDSDSLKGKPLPDKISKNLLVLSPPRSRASESLKTRFPKCYFDIAEIASRAGERSGKPAYHFPYHELPNGKTQPIVLDHIDYEIDDHVLNEWKLGLLERLVNTEARIVVLVSNVDLFYYLSRQPAGNRPQNDNLDRWAAILASCEKWNLDIEPDADNQGQTEEQNYSFWKACSEDEQLVLIQLAQEGVVNPKSTLAIRQLMRKRLIVRDPTFRIKNRCFERFVLSALPDATVKEWEEEAVHVPWGTILATLAIGLGAFLFVAQQAFFQTWVAYATGLGAAIPALVKVVGSFRRSPQSQPEP
jgi:hypothetical protein